jgi:uncharacterized protein YkwD
MAVSRGLTALVAALVLAAPASALTVAQRNLAERDLLHRINRARMYHGLPRLRVADRLEQAATRHSNSMARLGYFRHALRYKGTWKWFRTWIHWYWPGPGYTSWSAGENLAWGAPDLGMRKTMSLWMHSSPHRANVLSEHWKRIGLSVVHVTNPIGRFAQYSSVTIVTADFGSRR